MDYILLSLVVPVYYFRVDQIVLNLLVVANSVAYSESHIHEINLMSFMPFNWFWKFALFIIINAGIFCFSYL